VKVLKKKRLAKDYQIGLTLCRQTFCEACVKVLRLNVLKTVLYTTYKIMKTIKFPVMLKNGWNCLKFVWCLNFINSNNVCKFQ